MGGLNKFFFHFYQLRAKAKVLKQRNRTVYYVGKWVMIGGLLWAIFY